jgi:16S rRNA (adenine1518-N6/adenine1519-N6)-dimethyltransferase
MARQRLGQHFLADLGWQQRIFATLPRDSKGTWIEIGPGHGEMTHLLASKTGRVFAIEADAQLAAALNQKAHDAPAEWPGLEVVPGDVLTTDIGQLTDGPFRVYGNLPYYITSPILHHLFAYADRIASIHIVIQLEVAERIAARPGSRAYGYLSVACQFYTKPEIAMRLPPGAFRPPPKVTSALVQMTLPGERSSIGIAALDEARFLEFVQLCFGQKRKTLRNNLRSAIPDDLVKQALSACDLRPDARAEQLTLEQFATLFRQLPFPGK